MYQDKNINKIAIKLILIFSIGILFLLNSTERGDQQHQLLGQSQLISNENPVVSMVKTLIDSSVSFAIVKQAYATASQITTVATSASSLIPILYDNFRGGTYTLVDGQTSPNGKWHDVYNGDGYVGVKKDVIHGYVLFEHPKTSTRPWETHSSFVKTTSIFTNFNLAVDVKTVKQLRQNSPQNSWEVAWLLWKYTDSAHHYYFMLKTTGSEFGKKDGSSIRQIYLDTDPSPKVSIGKWSHWDITVVGNHITILVNGLKVVDTHDSTMSSKLSSAGSIVLYDEDSSVTFDNVYITPL